MPSLSAISSSFIPDFCACLTRSLIWSALLLRGLRFFGVSTSFFLASSLAIFSLTAAILLSNSVADAAFLFSNSKWNLSVFQFGHPNQQRFVPGFYGHVFLQTLNSVYTRSGQNSTPNSNATNLHSSQKRCCSFCISSSNASPTFQVQKSIFHQMTKPIQVTVILPLLLAISLSRNDDIHSSISGISNDLLGVIPTIGQ